MNFYLLLFVVIIFGFSFPMSLGFVLWHDDDDDDDDDNDATT